MDLNRILKQLVEERDRLDKAITALEAVKMPERRGFAQPKTKSKTSTRRGRRRISPAGLRRIALAQKRRWAKQRKRAKAAA